MNRHELELNRRQYLAERGDIYAIPGQAEKGSGAAHDLARELTGTKVNKANVRGLESLAWSTESIADILDYIRIRVGRDNRKEGWGKKEIGIRLADKLEKLRKDAEKFYSNKKPEDGDAVRRLHLDLCREFIKHLTALYEYYQKAEVMDDES